MSELEKIVECDCGWSCRGSETEITEACIAHGRDAHGIDLTAEQVLATARPVEPDARSSDNP